MSTAPCSIARDGSHQLTVHLKPHHESGWIHAVLLGVALERPQPVFTLSGVSLGEWVGPESEKAGKSASCLSRSLSPRVALVGRGTDCGARSLAVCDRPSEVQTSR